MPNKNNFNSGENKTKSKYCLWVLYIPGSDYYAKCGASRSYYSYNTGNEQNSLNRLMKLFESRKNQIKMAIIYDNQLGTQHVKLK